MDIDAHWCVWLKKLISIDKFGKSRIIESYEGLGLKSKKKKKRISIGSIPRCFIIVKCGFFKNV